MSASLAGLVFVLLAGTADHAPAVGVVCVGTFADEVGALQHTIELRLKGVDGVTLTDDSQLAPLLGRPATGEPRTRFNVNLAHSKTLLKQAIDAYYDDRAAMSLEHLGVVAGLGDLGESWWPVQDQIHLRLWRATIYLTLKDSARAQEELRHALVLDPQLKVDLGEFPPKLATLLKRVQRKRARRATVVLQEQPANATVEVDGRRMNASFVVPVGRHHVKVMAPNHRTVEQWITVDSDRVLNVQMPLSIGKHRTDRLMAIAWQKGLATKDDEALVRKLMIDAKINALVIAAVRHGKHPRAQGVFVATNDGGKLTVKTSNVLGPGSELNAELSAWAEDTVHKHVDGLRSSRAALSGTQPGGAQWEAAAELGALWSAWNRSVTDQTGDRYSHRLGGIGPRARFTLARGLLVGAADASFVTYSSSTLEVVDDNGATIAKVNGGSSGLFSVQLGARWRGPVIVSGGAGIHLETYQANDAMIAGERLGIQSAFTRTTLDVWGSLRYPVVIADIRIPLSASAFWSPLTSLSDESGDTLGASPTPGTDTLRWTAGAGYEMGRWTFLGEYLGGMRSVKFTGAGSAPVTPQLLDTEVRETLHGIVLTGRARF